MPNVLASAKKIRKLIGSRFSEAPWGEMLQQFQIFAESPLLDAEIKNEPNATN